MASPRQAGFSVRQRLTAAVAALTTAALVAVGGMLYVVESRRITESIDRSLAQEVGELRALQADGVDPDTRQPFGTPERLVSSFLSRNLPDPEEMLWMFPSTGEASYVGESDSRLQRSPAFRTLVDDLREDGGTRDLTIDGHDYRVAVQPVVQGTGNVAFVVSHDVSASRQPLRELLFTYTLLAALSVLLIAAVASWLAGRLLQPLRHLRETAQGITEGDLSGRLQVTGRDDLTDLQRTFNAMLDRLEDAFATQRRLLDDAAHELRTPLTVLRGHLEVVDPEDPQDVADTRALLLDEIDRMARLVTDLLLLAKARRPDFVRTEPTDLPALTSGVLERARGLADRRWKLDESADGTADVDAQRLTQALLQLAENAVHHTTTGDEIAVGSRWRDGALELWVRDSGPGVPADLRPTIFDRFAQGSDAGEGFGLGLSIVSAIAEAHGGTVVLDDTASGASFRIVLPGGAA